MIQECQWLILVIPKVNGWNRWLYLQHSYETWILSHLYLNLLPLKKMLLLQTVFIWLDFAHLSRKNYLLQNIQQWQWVPEHRLTPPPPVIRRGGCFKVHYFKGWCRRSNRHVWFRIIYHAKLQSSRDGARVHKLTSALLSVWQTERGCLWSKLCLAAVTNSNSLWFD